MQPDRDDLSCVLFPGLGRCGRAEDQESVRARTGGSIMRTMIRKQDTHFRENYRSDSAASTGQPPSELKRKGKERYTEECNKGLG